MIIDYRSKPGTIIFDMEHAEVLQEAPHGLLVKEPHPRGPYSAGPYSNHGKWSPFMLKNASVVAVRKLTFWERLRIAWRLVVYGSIFPR